MNRDDARTGHLPTLIACFLHFDLSFMLWVLLGSLGVFAASAAGLNVAQKGLMVAVPILSGSLLRIPLGILGDRIGGRRAGVALLAFLFVPLSLGWLRASSFSSLLAVGLTLGVGGASFAVALPLASRWYPPERQGLAMGIAAAGNSGTVLTNLVAPRLANVYGWHAVFGLAMVPLAVVLVAFALLARDTPAVTTRQPLRPLALLQHPDLWWLCTFYAVTFGGYVGLSSFLPIFFRDQFAVTPVNAGYLTALAAFAGSGARPVGGWLADKVGGVRLLAALLVCIAGAYALIARLPPLASIEVLLVFGMMCLGMANGAVFQVVPQRFPREIGAATGIIGALGGLGGFALPTLLGAMKQRTGSFGAGFATLALAALVAAIVLLVLVASQSRWRMRASEGLEVA